MNTGLRLYLVWRSGNEIEGPDGADTVFLARALDHTRAAELADDELLHFPHTRVKHWATGVYELGVSSAVHNGTATDIERIEMGPVEKPAYNTGKYLYWSRCKANDPWIFQGICPNCGFDFNETLDDAVSCCECGWDRTSYGGGTQGS